MAREKLRLSKHREGREGKEENWEPEFRIGPLTSGL